MHATPEQMHMTATQMSAQADGFWRDIEALSKEAETLMSSDWVGEAAETHAVLWTEWVDSAKKVAAALSEDATLIHRAADAYSRTDCDTSDAIAGISIVGL
ncbi:WXG100 family type VII secretion target [Nocardia sp. NPDC052566]|uniref:WXG100 family type VII secretion target n=1 Tax=Nocardia sp. NPDC052566 TaxID=3364330 RepID=UPI0037C82E95